MKTVYIVNVHPAVEAFVEFCKSFLPSKLRDRVVIGGNLETLQASISRTILPVDFGGEEISLENLNDVWGQFLLDFKPRFEELQKMKVNEKLRPGKPLNSDMLGLQGNFRKLDVD